MDSILAHVRGRDDDDAEDRGEYGDHLPLYRQAQIYAREGVDLDRSTLADWVGASSALLTPLLDALAKDLSVPYEGGVVTEVLKDASLKSDPIHPNARGYRVIAERVAERLKKAGAI